MARSILDDRLRSWEAFASTGAYGYSSRSRIVFSCTSDPAERPRAYTLDGDASDAEALAAKASVAELVALLERAQPLR